MLWVEDAWNREELPRPVAATIGNFDGVHRGQGAILERLVALGEEVGAPAVVVTFEPHPLTFLQPGSAPSRLVTRGEKERLLERHGVAAVLELSFGHELAELAPEEFVRSFLWQRLGARGICVGQSFTFGRNRQGDLELLRRLGRELGFAVEGVDEVLHEGEPVSSTRIRAAVAAGDVELATALLGRPYGVLGRVVEGDGRGRELGWPTINLELASDLAPADGVYLGRVRLAGGATDLPCVTNVGVRPTVGGTRRVVEGHILDFEGSLYGSGVRMVFLRRLREERKFATLEELARQIGRDVAAAREYFARAAC